MHVIAATNVNQALANAITLLMDIGEEQPSRNGPVLAFPGPVATEYSHPTQRVLFSDTRNANPTFHLLESLWMLAGRNDVKFPAEIVKNMKNFTDDGTTFHGAYGHRWREFFGWDQIDGIIKELKENPETRRAVLAMWNAMDSTKVYGSNPSDNWKGRHGGKDVPCNTHIYFDCRGGKLNMTVCNRSNDIIWGCYGANAVHMSFLQEYVATAVGLPVGKYVQFSNNLHLYLDKMPAIGLQNYAHEVRKSDMYREPFMDVTPLLREGEDMIDLDEDINDFFYYYDEGGLDLASTTQYETKFFNGTVAPMLRAWLVRKSSHSTSTALDLAQKIEGKDWRMSMIIWLHKNYAGGAA